MITNCNKYNLKNDLNNGISALAIETQEKAPNLYCYMKIQGSCDPEEGPHPTMLAPHLGFQPPEK